ncbi:IS110 family transposase [Companilactobacillus musae]|uniref:IS110 family transposase n=1 Tax=Companilactobacillus musae TaxID=1903258 RepID=UPI002010C7E7|nr:IS110 family transposase [Companilactobacillus musae]
MNYILKQRIYGRVKIDTDDAHKIAISAYENQYRLMTCQNPIYSKIRELNRFYERIEDSRKLNQVYLHTELQQTFPEIEKLFASRTSKLALNIVNLFPHPDLITGISRTKLKNILINETDKHISKEKALKYAEKLIRFAQNSCLETRVNDVQAQEVKYYSRHLIDITIEKEKLNRQIIQFAKSLPELEIISSMPGIGEMTAAQLIDLIMYQSGQYIRGNHINKRGNPMAQGILFLAVCNMIKQQASAPNHIVDYYKLKKQPVPKRDKVAVVACMNKTLKCLYSLIKNKHKYVYLNMN